MNDQLKDLIAVGSSVAANCQQCIKYHVGKAKEHGISQEDIKEAIKVGQAVRAGAAAGMDKFIQDLDLASAPTVCTPGADCACCG